MENSESPNQDTNRGEKSLYNKVEAQGSGITDPQLLNLVSQIHKTEDKINAFRSEIESTDKTVYKTKKHEFKTNTKDLRSNLENGPFSNNPNLQQEVHTGVENRILGMAEQIERQKREIEELKQVIKGKNEYIVTVQTDYKKYKKLYEDQSTEAKRLQVLLREKDFDISRKYRESNVEGKTADHKEKVRQAQLEKVTPQQYPKENANDPYNFWRTSNEPEHHSVKKTETNGLDDILGKNNLWVDARLDENQSGLGFATAEQSNVGGSVYKNDRRNL